MTDVAAPPGVIGLYRALWQYAEGKRGFIFASSVLLIGSEVVKLAVPWLAGQAINTVQIGGNDNLEKAGELMLLVFGASLLSWALHGPGRILERSVAVRVRETLSDRLYSRLVELPLAWHETHHSGETIHRVDRTTHALTNFAQNQFVYLQNIVSLVGPVIALMLLSRTTGLIALAGYAIIGLLILRFDRVMMRLADAENRGERRYSAALVDYLGNIGTVLSLRLREATRRLLGARLVAVFEPLKKSILVNESKWATVDLLNVALWASLVALYAWLAQRGTETLLLGNVFMVYQYTQQAGGVVVSIAANYQQFARYQIDYQSADPIWSAPAAAPQGAPRAEQWSRIEVRDLTFTHARRRGSGPSLHGVSIDFGRGERIALVGPSGSGKSTLMRVLAGLYAPEHGRFAIDGVGQPGLNDLSPVATLIPQDAEVFEGTLRENLTFGEPVPDADLRRAVELAALEPVLAALPNGLDTAISERGLNFSGGQKQRIALARGLVAARHSSLVLLDEPTASLDPVSEAGIYAGLDRALPDVCLVSSIHRLHLLARFDRVVLMAEGRVVDAGTLNELLARQPLMQQLWQEAGSAGEGAPQEVGARPSPIG